MTFWKNFKKFGKDVFGRTVMRELKKHTWLRHLVYVLAVPRNTWETCRKNVF